MEEASESEPRDYESLTGPPLVIQQAWECWFGSGIQLLAYSAGVSCIYFAALLDGPRLRSSFVFSCNISVLSIVSSF